MKNASRATLGKWLLRIRPAPLAALLKRLLGVRRIVVSTAHGDFWADPASYQGLELLERGIYEPDLVATVETYLPPDGTFVDLGANEGYFSVIGARRVGPNGRVLAIEPQSRLGAVLRRNFELNRCHQVTIAAIAVSDHPGTAELHLTPSMNNSASGLQRVTRYPVARQQVALATLQEVFDQAGIRHCDLLKMDIEGWEYEAVLGSRDLFKKHLVRAIALELHPNVLSARGLKETEITDFLTECGYRPVAGRGHLLLTVS